MSVVANMSISDKTRKILWGRSGNLCAICKHKLVVEATLEDAESVVGEECHINSSKENGPRHDYSYPTDQLDDYENLILLCRIHHKMVDDQSETYTAEILRQMRANHELWVNDKLSEDSHGAKPLKVRRVKQNIPSFLTRLTTGKQVLDIVSGAFAYSLDHDELESDAEVRLVSEFLQTIRDWGDIGDDMEPSDRVQTSFNLTQTLRELESAGFYVFGGREMRVLEGGNQATASDWPISIVNVVRKNSEEIIRFNMKEQGLTDSAPDNVGG